LKDPAAVKLLQIRFAKEVIKYEALLEIISDYINQIDKYLHNVDLKNFE